MDRSNGVVVVLACSLLALATVHAGCASSDSVANGPTGGGGTITTGGFGGGGGAAGGGGGQGCEPGEELCDGLDNDCNGQIDEGCACVEGDTQPCYGGDPALVDVGECAEGVQTCDLSGSWGECAGQVLPAAEQCNGLDDDCNGQVDDGFGDVTCGLGICQATVTECVEGSPVPCLPGDPNPNGETCDGTDDNCDGQVDEGCSCVDGQQQSCYTGSPATQGVGECQDGTQICNGGQWGTCNGDVTPQNETCDALDNNCDGQSDEGDPGGGAACGTGQPGVCSAGTEHCNGGQIVCQQNVQPSAEICDGLDNDCNGQSDEGNPDGGSPCDTGQPGVCAAGTDTCLGGSLQCVQNVLPGAEICDALDNDCDGQSDEGDPGGGATCSTGQQGVCAPGTTACQGGSIVCTENVQPSSEVCDGLDNDCNGQSDEGDPGGGAACSTGQPGVCAPGTTACQGGSIVCNQNVQPSSEVCDGLDNDCNGQSDEGDPGGGAACSTGQQGVCAPGTTACQGGSIICNQNVQPSSEVCDGLDNDCDGQSDEGDPGGGAACSTGQPGVCAPGTTACQGGSIVCTQNVQPSAEICDSLDNDCDGLTDEGNPGGGAACSTGQPGVCALGTTACQSGSIVCTQNVQPSAEICDSLDNDCDGLTDEGNPGGGAACSTGQPGVCAPGTTACQGGSIVCNQNVLPSAEICDSLDNDCDGLTDEGNPGGGAACGTGLPGVCAPGTTACQSGSIVCTENVPPSAEICDSLDNDCDGLTDEGNPGGGGACSTGLPGVCAPGTLNCSGGSLVCTENVPPGSEVCGDSLDNDCDGLTDEGCSCSHALCTSGSALVDGCDACVSQICGVDSFCCSSSWDSICVSEVRTVCDSLTCSESAGSCPHTLCTSNGASTPFTSGCDSAKANCVSQICTSDPFCCNTDWDSICVGEVSSVCSKNCTYQ